MHFQNQRFIMEGQSKRDNSNLFDSIMQRIVIPISICYMIWILSVKITSKNTVADIPNQDLTTELLEA